MTNNSSTWEEEKDEEFAEIIQDVCDDFTAIEEQTLTNSEVALIYYAFRNGRQFFYSLVNQILTDFTILPQQNPHVVFTMDSYRENKRACLTSYSLNMERPLDSIEKKLIDYGFDAGYHHSVKTFQAVTDFIITPPSSPVE